MSMFHTRKCCECGKILNDRELRHDWDTDRDYCWDCYCKNHILDYHEFQRNMYVQHGDSHNNSVPFMGIELEVDKGDDCNTEHAAYVSKLMEGFIHQESDGSLDDGFENITQPATLEYHLALSEKYHEMFKYLIQHKYRSHNTETCGLHIHFNRTFFRENEDLYITRLLYLFEKFWDNIEKFSRRTLESIRWAKKYNDTPQDVVEKAKHGDVGRYQAINLTNRNTIEIRIFRGTLRFETFIATLQFTDSLLRKIKTVDEKGLQALKWEDFLEYPEVKAYWETVKDRKMG